MPKSVRALNRELVVANSLAGDQAQKINRLNASISNLRSIVGEQAKAIVDRDMKVARLNGYIDRVREAEGNGFGGINVEREKPPTEQHKITADDIINMSDAQFSDMIKRLSPGRLDRLMGRGDDD